MVLDVKPRMRLRIQPPEVEGDEPVLAFFDFMKSIGKPSDTEIAEDLDLPRSIIWKLRNNKQRPSAEFIAAVKIKYPLLSMDRFFEAEVA